eukprot:m.116726 g.116726  ORF g.116726 m.116726 type:complete len:148 (-) comp13616_c0_seq16:293-736(-)
MHFHICCRCFITQPYLHCNKNHSVLSWAKRFRAPMHVHADAWNALIYGQKLWTLLPPTEALYSTKHPAEFLDEDLAHLNPGTALKCTQSSGDVMYVPAMWSHSVLNQAESIGFASEFVFGGSVFTMPTPSEIEAEQVMFEEALSQQD